MRLDQEAAVTAYRAANAEDDRVLMAGGSTKVTDELSSVATGEYLKFVLQLWRQAKEEGLKISRRGTIVYAAAQDWSQNEVRVKACEDAAGVRVVDEKGRDRTPPGQRRYVQDYTVVRTNDGWKVADLDSKRVASFDSEGCNS